MHRLKIIAITHKRVEIDRIGRYHLEDEQAAITCPVAKEEMELEELLYLSTCNRVEFMVVTPEEIDNDWLDRFFAHLYPKLSEDEREDAVLFSEVYEGLNAVEHLFNVTSSLDSLVVGEREIITQVRTAFEKSKALGITGDLVRLIMRKTVETAKEIYTQTEIASRPVSVVSLAYRQLLEYGLPKQPRVLMVGAGETNTNLGRFLKKHGFGSLHVYNRSVNTAEKLAAELGGEGHPLDALPLYAGGFDILVACTGAAEPVITNVLYEKINDNDQHRKIVVDLGVPADVASDIDRNHPIHRIEVASLQPIAERNVRAREKEMQLCRAIISKNLREFQQMYRERKVELAMAEVPGVVKNIHEKAMQEVFAKEIENLDDNSREVLEKVLQYVEKKYISVPMRMAKDIMLQKGMD